MSRHRLTRRQVARARILYADRKATHRELAQKFGVSLPAMRHAVNGTTWRDLTDPPPVAGLPPLPQSLTADHVRQARQMVAKGQEVADVARLLAVRYQTLNAAVYGLTWRHLTDPPPLERPEPIQAPPEGAALDEDAVRVLRRDYSDGVSISTLARRYGVADTTVRSAIHGATWRHVTDPPPVPVADVGGALVLSEDDEREVVRLRDQDGLTWKEIGARLGVSKSTALRAYLRAKVDDKKPLPSR